MRAVIRRIVGFMMRLSRRLAIVPLRARGVVLAGAGAFVSFKLGRSEADYLLYPAGLCAIALVGVCALCVAAGSWRLWRVVRRSPADWAVELDTGHPVRTELTFPTLAWWPLIDVRLAWDRPAEVAVTQERVGRVWREVITPRERGRHAVVVRRFTVADVFGLTAMSFTVTRHGSLRIAPAPAVASAVIVGGFGSGDAFSHPSGQPEGDLIEMRAYGAGDPMRHILWKTFARTRRLLVRIPERAIAPQPTSAAFLIAGVGDEPSCATARLYLERSLFGRDFVFCAGGAREPARDAAAALEQIIDSVARRGDGGADLALQAAMVDSARLGACIVFAPAVDGAWRDHVVAFARRLPSPPTVIIGVDGEAPPAARSLVARVLVRPAGQIDADGRALAEVPRLRAALEAEGIRVQVIHRSTGQLL